MSDKDKRVKESKFFKVERQMCNIKERKEEGADERINEQECIPVGCVPLVAVAVREGGLEKATPPRKHPPFPGRKHPNPPEEAPPGGSTPGRKHPPPPTGGSTPPEEVPPPGGSTPPCGQNS